MNRTVIGLLFIACGLAYGSMAIDVVYNHTLGYLVQNQWVNVQVPQKIDKNALGRKPTIFLYSLVLIIIGIFILWNRNT